MLKALLLGYHVSITDDELLQASDEVENTDSTTGLLQLAQQFGLQIEQALLPADHLYLTDALPALVMLRPITKNHPIGLSFGIGWGRSIK